MVTFDLSSSFQQDLSYMVMNSSRNQSSYAPVSAVDNDDQFEQLNSSPLTQDVVKAIVAVVLMAIVLYGLPTWRNLWSQRATEGETQSTSTMENSSVVPPATPVPQGPRRPEKQQRRNSPQEVRDDDVEQDHAQQPSINRYNNVFSFEVNLEQHNFAEPREMSVPDQRNDVRTVTYFDNAGRSHRTKDAPIREEERSDARAITYFDNTGRSYRTKAARDRAEDQHLTESLADYPHVSTQQRMVLRRRAFTRLEQMDIEQRMAFGQ
jgi:hypothetical protein